MNCYIHILPGRMRIRTDFLKKNELGAFSLRSGVFSLQGIRSVVINTITGSILIRFDVLQTSSQEILATLAQHKAIPHVDCKQPENSKQVIRVQIVAKDIESFNIWPFVLKRAVQYVLGSLDLQPGVLYVLTNIVMPSIVEVL